MRRKYLQINDLQHELEEAQKLLKHYQSNKVTYASNTLKAMIIEEQEMKVNHIKSMINIMENTI